MGTDISVQLFSFLMKLFTLLLFYLKLNKLVRPCIQQSIITIHNDKSII